MPLRKKEVAENFDHLYITFSGQGCLVLVLGVAGLPKKFVKKVGNPLDSR